MSDPGKAVFLSYASQDAEAAKRICDALRQAGVEVWFDTDGGLEHGDEWDQKIRRQIKECVLFLPLISANTQAREEGYFRIEWELAAERAMGIASGTAFILPIVIDDTKEPAALVPDRFRKVQWTKLPGGVLTPDVQARFLKLWSHRAGVVKHLSEEKGARSREQENQGPEAAAALSASGWKVYAGLAVTIFILVGVAGWWLLRRPAPAAPLAVTAAGPAAPLSSPARDWPKNPELKRAIALIEGLESIPDDFALAEQIVKPIIERTPTDLEAVTVMARVQSHYMRRGFDRSDERSAQAQRYTERALQLGPNEPEAMYAAATYLYSRAIDNPRTERLLRRAMELDPQNPRLGRLLADLFNNTNRPAEAIAQGQDNVRRFPGDVLSHYDLARTYKDQGRYEEFDRELDATLTIASLPNAIVWKARLQFGLHNDFAGMKTWLDRVPERVRGTERAVFSYFLYGGFGGDPESGLEALRGFPQKWFTDFEYAGPTALLNASLLELQGKTELARQQYEAALAEIQRMRATDPGRIGLNSVEFWTLLGLGRHADARASHRRMIEGLRRPYAQYPVNGWWFSAIPGSLLLGERATALTLLRESLENLPESRAAFRLRFQIDPRMAPFRTDPEITALLAEPVGRLPVDGGRKPEVGIPIDQKSVAVLAFANLSDDKGNEYFSDGISEELLTVLQKIPGLHVAARTSAFSFKGQKATAQEIGAKLGVANLVEGSVQKSGNRVKVTARLSRVATGEELWSRSYTRELKDAFALQEELATAIVGELSTQLPGGAAVASQVKAAIRGGTTNSEAHQLYLQGRYILAQFSMENMGKAIGCFERATALDPDFALAWAALSRAHAMHVGWSDRMTQAEFTAELAQARRAADRALALQPDMPEALNARFEVQFNYDFDFRGGAAVAQRALALAPADPVMLSASSRVAGLYGQGERAVELLRQAVALDPVNAEIRVYLALALVQVQRWADARSEFARVATLSPTTPWAYAGAGLTYLYEGKYDQALTPLEHESTEFARQLVSVIALWGLHKTAESDAVLAQMIKVNGDVGAYQIAEIYGFRGDKDQAFAWLERAHRQRDAGIVVFTNDPFFNSLKDDPRWAQFRRKLGLAADQLK